MDFGLTSINILDEFGVLSTPASRISTPTDISHWSTPDIVFGEGKAVGMSAARSDQD